MTDDELKRLFEETRRDFRETADRLSADNAAIRQESAAAHAETRRDFRETVDRLSAENRHYFEVATEAMKHEIGLIAEKVMAVDEKLDRTAENLDEKIERTAAETQAMIKFSHEELHRRVRALEETQRTVEQTLADLQSRVERLEGSTH